MGRTTGILVIGGGVIGLSIARELHRRGLRDITILDKGTCGREASWAAAGMLSPQAETDDAGPFLDLCVRSRDLYPQFANELLAETGIDVELDQTGTLVLAFNDEDADRLMARFGWQRAAGLALQAMFPEDIIKVEPFLPTTFVIGARFPNDWQVENRKLVTALRRYAELNGINVIENTTVDRLIAEAGRVLGARSTAGEILAEHTVVATGAWTSLIKLDDAELPFQVIPIRGQIACLEAPVGTLEHVVCTHSGYLVPRRDGRILVGSTTEDVGYDASTTTDAISALVKLAGRLLRSTPLKLIDSWAGLRPHAPDGLPVLGGIPGLEGVSIATAHYRNGILLAPLTAAIVADRLMDSTENEAFTTFGPGRFSVAAAT
jgi:glycine oxidase